MISTKLEKYIEEFTTVENEVLRELNRQTHLRTFYPRMLSGSVQGKFLEMICRMLQPKNVLTFYPRMLSGSVQGKFLEMICRMLQPKNVLEIGTFTGYSAIAMAMGMPENGPG